MEGGRVDDRGPLAGGGGRRGKRERNGRRPRARRPVDGDGAPRCTPPAGSSSPSSPATGNRRSPAATNGFARAATARKRAGLRQTRQVAITARTTREREGRGSAPRPRPWFHRTERMFDTARGDAPDGSEGMYRPLRFVQARGERPHQGGVAEWFRRWLAKPLTEVRFLPPPLYVCEGRPHQASAPSVRSSRQDRSGA